jgi:hypothetical protein
MQPLLRTSHPLCLVVCVEARGAARAAADTHDVACVASPGTGRTDLSMCSRSATFELPSAAPSIPVSRYLVRELLRAWEAPQDRDDAALLVTELVANVVDHADGDVSLSLEVTSSDDWLRIAVLDGSAVLPVVQEVSIERPRGRGLLMVQMIATRWGSEAHQGGKRVWFELGPADPQRRAGLPSRVIGEARRDRVDDRKGSAR